MWSSGYHDYFCLSCAFLWHERQKCQQYRVLHPELCGRDEARQLHEMARLGAQYLSLVLVIIVDEGGCDHIHCEHCYLGFIFQEAEHVIALPSNYMPAPMDILATNP